MVESQTSICNMSLARFGAERITDYGDNTDTKKSAIYCRLFYTQTAKALMRSHLWRFARHRVQLSQDTETPAFEYTYAYTLPNDFLRHILIWDGSDLPGGRVYTSYDIEGDRLLIDESTVYMKYIRWVESPASWDSLFIEIMVLQLAKKLCMPLSQSAEIEARIDDDLYGNKGGRPGLMSRVRAMDRQEAEHWGRDELKVWLDARYSDTA